MRDERNKERERKKDPKIQQDWGTGDLTLLSYGPHGSVWEWCVSWTEKERGLCF